MNLFLYSLKCKMNLEDFGKGKHQMEERENVNCSLDLNLES